MDKSTTCCFTGHRPDKLPWGTHEDDPRCMALKQRLDVALMQVYDGGVRHFICGMARGADLYFAEAVLALRERRPGVTLECARPCESQAHSWPQKEQERYQSILDRCDYETLVQHRYDRFCMMRRNRYMVDASRILIAAFDGRPGGTARTLEYAARRRLEIIQIPIDSAPAGR